MIQDGVLLVDKPEGCTSFDVVREVRKLVGRIKIGHAGTLDPAATGLLPLLIGEATKLASWLIQGSKRYRASIRLGAATDTHDATGRITAEAFVPALSRLDIEQALGAFLGRTEQVPPMYSALHHEGQRLYELARKGIEVERGARTIEIEAITLLAHRGDGLEIDVTCSAGTYIRTIASDLGKRLGTLAHLASLRRLCCAGFALEDAVPLASLDRATLPQAIVPLERVFERWPRIALSEAAFRSLVDGRRFTAAELRALGVIPDKRETYWSSGPSGRPVVLFAVEPPGSEPPMAIERVFWPAAKDFH